MLNFSLVVQKCEGVNQIRNLNTLFRSQDNSSLYTASCDVGHSLLHGDRDYECHNQQWIPELSCDKREPKLSRRPPTVVKSSQANVKYFATYELDQI